MSVTFLKNGVLKLKEIREKMIEKKIIETNFSFLFHNITVSEKQEVTMSVKEIVELKQEKRRKIMNLSVNLNADKKTTSVSMDFKMQKELEENNLISKKKQIHVNVSAKQVLYVRQQQKNEDKLFKISTLLRVKNIA